jgi:hypothetical protein
MVRMGGVKANATIEKKGRGYVKAAVIAEKYAVTQTCIRLWAKSGKIPSIRFEGCVRFDPAAVAAVIEGGAA